MGALAPRTLVVGIEIGGGAKAYPMDALLRQSPLIDTVGDTPLIIVVNEDGKSVRAFERTIDGRTLEFFRKPDSTPLRLVDGATGSEWDFAGACVSGELTGKQLKKAPVLKDYWFNWKAYHPDTGVYLLGER